MRQVWLMLTVIAALAGGPARLPDRVQPTAVPSTNDARCRPLDQLLDLHVRDGLVYYGALKADRGRLRDYRAALDGPVGRGWTSWPKADQIAFWINAYNGIVLDTIIDHYPIRGVSPVDPSDSVRQIPGAFDRTLSCVGGRSITLDAIEKTVLSEFGDPRVYLALGRGAVGSGRLRSEAYSGARLERQLSAVAAELVTRAEMLRVDRVADRITVTPIVGWHEADFVAAYRDAPPILASRSPIERAVVALIAPHLLPLEREFVMANRFESGYHDLDWHLNDLDAGRR